MIGVCESLLYGYKAGLQLDRMVEFDPRRSRRLLDAGEPGTENSRS